MTLETVRADAALAGELEWLSESESAAWTDLWRRTWAGAPWDPAFVALGQVVADRCRVVATAGARARRVSQQPCPLLVVHDPEQDTLSLLPSLAFPPVGRPSAGSTARSLAQALADFRRDPVPVTGLKRVLRLVKALELDDASLILNTVDATEPWMDDGGWGSAHDEDPYDALPVPPRPFDLVLVQRTAADQHPQRPQTWALRTLWSRSALRIERHPYGLWVFELRYDPVTPDDAAERLTGGTAFPADLPVDLLPSCLRGDTLVPDAVRGTLAAEPSPFYLAAACALALGDPETAASLPALALPFAGTEHEGLAAEVLATYGQHAALSALGRASETVRPSVEALLGGAA